MSELKFNKSIKTNYGSGVPSVVFRKLSKIGTNDRYQGNVNVSGVEFIHSVCGDNFAGFDVVFSDEHCIIGFKPDDTTSSKRITTFGATQLFRCLKLKTGAHYALTINGDIAVIDSNEFN